jgi:hypothetical protein
MQQGVALSLPLWGKGHLRRNSGVDFTARLLHACTTAALHAYCSTCRGLCHDDLMPGCHISFVLDQVLVSARSLRVDGAGAGM